MKFKTFINLSTMCFCSYGALAEGNGARDQMRQPTVSTRPSAQSLISIPLEYNPSEEAFQQQVKLVYESLKKDNDLGILNTLLFEIITNSPTQEAFFKKISVVKDVASTMPFNLRKQSYNQLDLVLFAMIKGTRFEQNRKFTSPVETAFDESAFKKQTSALYKKISRTSDLYRLDDLFFDIIAQSSSLNRFFEKINILLDFTATKGNALRQQIYSKIDLVNLSLLNGIKFEQQAEKLRRESFSPKTLPARPEIIPLVEPEAPAKALETPKNDTDNLDPDIMAVMKKLRPVKQITREEKQKRYEEKDNDIVKGIRARRIAMDVDNNDDSDDEEEDADLSEQESQQFPKAEKILPPVKAINITPDALKAVKLRKVSPSEISKPKHQNFDEDINQVINRFNENSDSDDEDEEDNEAW